MTTGSQVEDLYGQLSREEPKTSRAKVLQGLTHMGDGLSGLDSIKAGLDAVVAATAESDLTAVQADWGKNLREVVAGDGGANPGWTRAGKSGVSALAQLIADLSEQAGLEGGANRIRICIGQPGAETVVAVDQDA